MPARSRIALSKDRSDLDGLSEQELQLSSASNVDFGPSQTNVSVAPRVASLASLVLQ